MWQIAEELEQQRKKRDAEERRKATTAVAVLNIRLEDPHYLAELTLLIPLTEEGGGFREVKVRGPRRGLRAEAIKDGFVMRAGFYQEGGGEAEVRRRQMELRFRVWTAEELPEENVRIDEKIDQEHRLRLAQRPRGTGWTRKKDKEFFEHTQAPMAYDPKKKQYFEVDPTTQQYFPCEQPHDPTEYPVAVSAGASLVGRDDAGLTLPERPRSLLLKELVKTGAAMKKPLFFLDQPASCFALFEGLRGNAAVDLCSKTFHTKLLSKLSSSLQYWSESMVRQLLNAIFEELETEILQQATSCYDGVSAGVALLIGDRLTVATLGAIKVLLLTPAGEVRVLGDQSRVEVEGPERSRLDAAVGQVVEVSGGAGRGGGKARLAVRRPVQPRETAIQQEQSAEIARVLHSAPDSFATLGFDKEDAVDAKAAKAHYRKLALKVHPDKAPEDMKSNAKEAFAKIEASVAQIETLYETDAEVTNELHKILVAAGSVCSPVMPRSWAVMLLGIDEEASLEEAEKKAAEIKKTLGKLGQFADGRQAHPDTIRAAQLLDEALEVLAAPDGSGSSTAGRDLEAVPVTGALGLRDLKRPRSIVSASPKIHYVPLDRSGNHHIAMLSSSTTVGLSDGEIATQIRRFGRQPKAASLLIAGDAAKHLSDSGASAADCLSSAVVGVLEVKEEKAQEPPTKKAKLDAGSQADKARCLHILLKHVGLKMAKDVDSMQRLKGKGPVKRTVAQAEREMLEMQRQLAANPNIFHVLARKHSECDTALQPGQSSGDLGWVTRGTSANPQFEAAMFALNVYEVSDIVSTPRGLHILQRIA